MSSATYKYPLSMDYVIARRWGYTKKQVQSFYYIVIATAVYLDICAKANPAKALFFQQGEQYLAGVWTDAAAAIALIAAALRSWLIIAVIVNLFRAYNSFRQEDSFKDMLVETFKIPALLTIGDLIVSFIVT